MRNNSSLRIARSIRSMAYQILKFKEEYCTLNGIEPNTKLIASRLNITETDVKYALDSLSDPVSIFEPVFDDGGLPIYLIDQIADENENVETGDTYLLLSESLKKISKREREILVGRYFYGETQSELAQRFGVSQAQISRIEKSGLKELKSLMQ